MTLHVRRPPLFSPRRVSARHRGVDISPFSMPFAPSSVVMASYRPLGHSRAFVGPGTTSSTRTLIRRALRRRTWQERLEILRPSSKRPRRFTRRETRAVLTLVVPRSERECGLCDGKGGALASLQISRDRDSAINSPRRVESALIGSSGRPAENSISHSDPITVVLAHLRGP